jgi:hypothetical protein
MRKIFIFFFRKEGGSLDSFEETRSNEAEDFPTKKGRGAFCESTVGAQEYDYAMSL